jgi:hypothetical protein
MKHKPPLISALVMIAATAIESTADVALAGDVRGKVVTTRCPGPDRIGVTCPALPLVTTVDVFGSPSEGAQSATPVKSVATDRSGHFKLWLPNGRYLLKPRPPKPGMSSKPTAVMVTAGVTTVTLRVDSGMR